MDSLKSRVIGAKQIRRRLKHLRASFSNPRPVVRREILNFQKRILFGLGLILPSKWFRSFGVFVAGALVLVLVVFSFREVNAGLALRKQVLGTATAGFEFLTSGRDKLLGQDLSGAAADFALAEEQMERSRHQLDSSGGALSRILPLLPQGQDVQRVFDAGILISRSLGRLAQGADGFENTRLVWDRETNSSDRSFFLAIQQTRSAFYDSAKELGAALALLAEINPENIPENIRGDFIDSVRQLSQADLALGRMIELETALLRLLGGEPQTYLLLFQNNNELRAGGGFIGTYGLLEFGDGRMKILKIESVYDLDGQLKERIVPPSPLQRHLTHEWGLRDSNWFVDFELNAAKALEFLEKEAGIRAGGVIAATPDFFEGLLALTGPVEMPGYGERLTAENFREVAQFKTSLDYDRDQNTPKKFLADFAPALLGQIQNMASGEWLAAVDLLGRMIYEKHFLVYSKDENIERVADSYNAAGKIRQTAGDYLAIFHSSVGGGKTSRQIAETVDKRVEEDGLGNALVTLKITRTHNDFEEQYFPKNVDYMRILVPMGSELISSSGFDDYVLAAQLLPGAVVDGHVAAWEESIRWNERGGMFVGMEAGYAEFSNWMELLPGQSRSVEIVYRLPFEIGRKYTQLLQKQPGSPVFDFGLTVIFPEKPVFYYPERAETAGRAVIFREVVRSDQFYAAVGE